MDAIAKKREISSSMARMNGLCNILRILLEAGGRVVELARVDSINGLLSGRALAGRAFCRPIFSRRPLATPAKILLAFVECQSPLGV